MAITTYTELRTAVENWAERSDFSLREPEFITLADMRIRRDLAALSGRLREMETRSDITPSSGACTLPTDFMAVKKVQARTSTPRRLEYKDEDWLDEAYPDGASGDPAFYTIYGGSLYMFPLTTSDIRLTYYAYPAVLSGSNASNWLLVKYPDIYLWAALLEVETYAANAEGMDRYGKLYQSAMQGLDRAAFGAALSPGTSRTSSIAAQ